MERQDLLALKEQLKMIALGIFDTIALVDGMLEKQGKLSLLAEEVASNIISDLGDVKTLTPDELKEKIAKGMKITFAKGGKY